MFFHEVKSARGKLERGCMDDWGLVSVVTATYNMGNYLPETVGSVLAQTYQNYELIVVDDGSQDNTPEVMEQFSDNPKIRYVRLDSNRGQTVAKNRGLAEAKGRFIGFVDADNLWKPFKLEHQFPLFTKFGKTGVVYSDAEYIDGDGNVLPYINRSYHEGNITGKLLLSNFVNFNSALVKRECIQEVGGFDENLSMGIDWDLWLRISTKYEFAFLPEQTYSYRLWANQMSHQKAKRLNNAEKIIEKFEKNHPGVVSTGVIDEAKALLYKDYALIDAASGQKIKAFTNIIKAIRMKPTKFVFWKAFAKIIANKLD
jgi:glycosyltransferase involved in cell wall biosynthesis